MTTAVATQFIVGDETMRRVFYPARLTNLSDLQAVLDAVEVALSNSKDEERGQNSRAGIISLAESVLSANGFHSGLLHERIQSIALELTEAQSKLDESADWPEWATKCLKIIRANTGADGYDDATEGVDLPGELEEVLALMEEEKDILCKKAVGLELKAAELEEKLKIAEGNAGPYIRTLGDAERRIRELTDERDELKFRLDGLEK